MNRNLLVINTFLLVVVVILGLFLLFQQKKISRQAAIISPTFAIKKPLPALYVKQSTIHRADTHAQVQLKGVSSKAFSCKIESNGASMRGFITILNELRLWNINMLGLFVHPDCLQNRMNELDNVILWAEKHHVYVYLMPVTYSYQPLLPQTQKLAQLMGMLANRYADRNHVMYGFWAEPEITNWQEWEMLATSIAERIVYEKPSAVMFFSGIDFGRTFQNENLPYKNIVYDIHDYPARNAADLKQILSRKKLSFLWNEIKYKRPLLIGEFGGVWEPPFSTPEDLVYLKKALKSINKNKLSYSAYTIDKRKEVGDTEKDLQLIDWETGKPTKRGIIIKEDLLRNPPTDFSK